MSEPDVIAMLEGMVENGHPPAEGCQLFGAGYDEAFSALKETYLLDRFDRAGSAEKFVVGPFGSGKTHFMRHLMEIARDLDCVTSEVSLNKDLQFTDSLMVYREVAREVRAPGRTDRGIKYLMLACLDKVRENAPSTADPDQFAEAWIAGLDDGTFELESFARIAKIALASNLRSETSIFESACRWLGGEVNDRILAKDLSLVPIPKSEHNLHGRRAMLSMFQLTRRSGLRGTVVGFDEAEQGLSVDKKTMGKINSLLQSGINAMANLKGGAALIIFALTPDLVEEMKSFAALQQRISDPGPGESFWDGNHFASLIDLSYRDDPVAELRSIGAGLVDMLYDRTHSEVRPPKDLAISQVAHLAAEVNDSDASVSSRRTMVRRTCRMLLDLQRKGTTSGSDELPSPSPEGEV